ncbi:MAG: glucoamylase family protein [Candidatus Omnitrophota bacterium]|nr:glucoamylase family protein [Candidatus Omnitrophota bacterium]
MKLFIVFFIACYACLVPTARAEILMGLSDAELLETIERKAFDYFVYERDSKTGLVKDKAHNFQRGATKSTSSIAATGFALTAYGVGVQNGWMDISTAREMTRRTLHFFLHNAASERGFFYHFLNMETGERARRSELSPIDTALFLAGALYAAEYYDDQEIRDLATQLYERVDWAWMLHGELTLAKAWSPETGFEKYRWDSYDEAMIMYLLAIGSPTHPLPAESWQAVARPVGSYGGYRVIQMPPLFTHQYSHIWIDFRNKNDGYADYFQNSVNATLANRAFCIKESAKFSSYGATSWGLTASDGPFGYRAFGAPPGWAEHNGTIAPTGCGGSIVFTPEESIACLRHFYEDLGESLWGMYGFSDAFNLDKNWFSRDVLGIDQGTLLLMIENYRSGHVWDVMSRNTYLAGAMELVGFRSGTKEVPWPDPPKFHAPYLSDGIKVDGYLKDWPNGEVIILDKSHKETGSIQDDKDLKAEVRFAWSEQALYFYAKVTDESVLVRKSGKDIWLDDLIEIYIDPAGDGLSWGDDRDYQIGFRAREEDEEVLSWSWFQGGEDPGEKGMVAARGFVYEDGYIIEGGIRWRYLGLEPSEVETLKLSVAVHDIDHDRSQGKVQWFFRNEDELKRFVLGEVVLTR